MAAVARVLETHTKALDLEGEDAKQEYEASVKLVEQHRRIASELRSLSEQMACTATPMGRHDLEAWSAPEAVEVFERLVNFEQELRLPLEQRLGSIARSSAKCAAPPEPERVV